MEHKKLGAYSNPQKTKGAVFTGFRKGKSRERFGGKGKFNARIGMRELG